ncbi:Uncharacterised protein [Micrococcus luteus]|nr:Uncharacterised protein [Micrococcus luteus]
MRPKGGWASVRDVEIAVAEYVDWYNHRRLHGEIGHVPPAEFEAATGHPTSRQLRWRTGSPRSRFQITEPPETRGASGPRPSTRRRRTRRTWCGRWTSSSTPTSTDDRSRSARSSTNTPGSASAGSWSARLPPTDSPPTSRTSSPPGAPRRCSGRTTGRSSSARRWPTGPAPAPACPTSSGLAVAQRVRRVVQQPDPRRVPQHQQLLLAAARTGHHRRLEGRVQPPPPALLARLPNPSRVRSAVHPSNGNRRLTERPDRMKGRLT